MAFPIHRTCPSCGVLTRIHGEARLDQLRGPWFVDTGDHRLSPARSVWTEHVCDEQDVAAYGVLKAAVLADASTWVSAQLATLDPVDPELVHSASTRLRELNQEIDEIVAQAALTTPCPKCEVGAGDPCENLTRRRSGERVFTANPHAERLPLPSSTAGRRIEVLRGERDTRYDELDALRSAAADRNRLTRMLDLIEQLTAQSATQGAPQ